MRQEGGKRIAQRRLRGWVVLVQAIDQHDQALAARHELALRHARQHPGQPRRRMHPRIRLRFAQHRKAVLQLRHQRADQLRRVVPVVLTAADKVMRYRRAGRFAARQPRRQDRALAHPRTAGDHDPAVAIAVDQQLIEAGQQRRAANELLVALPLAAVVEPLPGHPQRPS